MQDYTMKVRSLMEALIIFCRLVLHRGLRYTLDYGPVSHRAHRKTTVYSHIHTYGQLIYSPIVYFSLWTVGAEVPGENPRKHRDMQTQPVPPRIQT